jgi:hypothetical protein
MKYNPAAGNYKDFLSGISFVGGTIQIYAKMIEQNGKSLIIEVFCRPARAGTPLSLG